MIWKLRGLLFLNFHIFLYILGMPLVKILECFKHSLDNYFGGNLTVGSFWDD